MYGKQQTTYMKKDRREEARGREGPPGRLSIVTFYIIVYYVNIIVYNIMLCDVYICVYTHVYVYMYIYIYICIERYI